MPITTEQTLAAELAAIRADLAELRRYVRMQPAYVEQGILGACRRLWSAAKVSTAVYASLNRVAWNLDAARDAILACPDALEGYLAGADWELAVLVGRLEATP